MNRRLSFIAKTSLLIAAVAFVVVAGFSLPHFAMNMSMDMHGNMTMTDCYMPGMTAVCNMSPLEHISSWQSMFTSILTQNNVLSLLLLLFVSIVASVWIRQTLSPLGIRQSSPLFSRRREYIPLHSQFQELFSRGVLNPKLF